MERLERWREGSGNEKRLTSGSLASDSKEVFLTHHKAKALQDTQLAMQSSRLTIGGNPTQNVGVRKS